MLDSKLRDPWPFRLKIVGVRGDFRITRVWLRYSEAEVRAPPNSVRTSSLRVAIER